MCGIAGFVTLDGLAPKSRFEAMAASLAHRGPDGQGVETFPGSPSCVLAHRRLSILDLSPAGAQPMADARREAWVVFNGEIYNYLELREELKRAGHAFHTASDTEVLLAAWREWGEAMLPRLNGMFALALWDSPRRRLFLARDRFGEKPLFWRATARSFAFASELRALRTLEPDLFPRASVDREWLHRMLAAGRSEHEPSTILEGVRRLPPASATIVSAGVERLTVAEPRTWWTLPPAGSTTAPPDADVPRLYRELFDDAVKIRLRSDVPVGTSLSGGLDSSAVVTTVARQLGGASAQHTYSFRSEDPALDEGRYAGIIAETAHATMHTVTPTAADVARDFDRLVVAQEEPFPTLSIYAQFRVFELAKAGGTVVLLDGQGSDEVLAGYAPYVGIAASERFFRGRVGEAREILESAPTNNLAETRREAFMRAIRLRAPRLFRAAVLARRGFRKRVAAVPPLFRADAAFPLAQPGPPPARERWLDAQLRYDATGGPLQTLLRYADRNSMAHSREVRLPFLDHRLVELSFSLPDRWKVGGFTKRVLREAMADRIPDEVRLRRDKLGFQASDALWLTGPLRGWLVERAHAAVARFPDWLDPDAVERALAAAVPDGPHRAAAISAIFPWASAEASVRALSAAG